jgi:hypothetical protein
MSSQPEKDGDNEDTPGMTTRAKSQQPLISNLFNSHANNLLLIIYLSSRALDIIHPQRRGQTLASPARVAAGVSC